MFNRTLKLQIKDLEDRVKEAERSFCDLHAKHDKLLNYLNLKETTVPGTITLTPINFPSSQKLVV